MKPGMPVMRSARLLDQVRERIRYLHYSLSTEKAYLYWVRFFVRWSGRSEGMRHPRDMGVREVEAFLTMLATERMDAGQGRAQRRRRCGEPGRHGLAHALQPYPLHCHRVLHAAAYLADRRGHPYLACGLQLAAFAQFRRGRLQALGRIWLA